MANLSRNALEATIDRLSSLSLVNVLPGEDRYALHPLTRTFVRGEVLSEAHASHEVDLRFGKTGSCTHLNILVEFDKTPNLFEFMDLEEYLEHVLNVKVDLVSRQALRGEIGERILGEVVTI